LYKLIVVKLPFDREPESKKIRYDFISVNIINYILSGR
jgi:hypothetical protein